MGRAADQDSFRVKVPRFGLRQNRICAYVYMSMVPRERVKRECRAFRLAPLGPGTSRRLPPQLLAVRPLDRLPIGGKSLGRMAWEGRSVATGALLRQPRARIPAIVALIMPPDGVLWRQETVHVDFHQPDTVRGGQSELPTSR